MKSKLNPTVFKKKEIFIFTVAIFAGLFLRVFQLNLQIVADDEWHAIHKLFTSSYIEILSVYGGNDYSIPATLFFKFISETIGLSEFWMRLPSFTAGFLILILFPVIARTFFSSGTALIFAWALAISPLLIFYSRTTRPYSTMALFSFLAVVFFFRWWEMGRKINAFAYVICTVIAAYFHIISLPFLLTPILFFSIFTVKKNHNRKKNIVRLFKIALLVFIPLALSIGIPLIQDYGAIASKMDIRYPTSSTLLKMSSLYAGTSNTVCWAFAIFLCVTGFYRLWREQPFLTAYFVVLIEFQFLAIWFSMAIGTSAPHIFARYCIPTLPIFLLAFSCGISFMVERFPLKTRGLLLTFFFTLLFLFGPIPSIYYYPNNWTNHHFFQGNYEKEKFVFASGGKERDVPPFYHELGLEKKGSKIIVEGPWRFENGVNKLFAYQKIHRQKVKIGFVNGLCSPPRLGEYIASEKFKFSHFIHLKQRDSLLAEKIDYVVFHKNEKITPQLLPDVTECITTYKHWFGAPVFSDAKIEVFKINKKI